MNMSWKTLSLDKNLLKFEPYLTEFVCRICLDQNCVKDITTNDYETKSATENVLNFIGIDLTLLSLPTKICTSCFAEVENIKEFRIFCQESQRKLLDKIQQGSQECKPEPFKSDYDEIDDFSDLDIPTPQNSELDVEKAVLYADSNISELELNNSINIFVDLNEEAKSKTIKKVRKKPISPFYCKLRSCRINFDSKESLDAHNINIHGFADNINKCFGCGKTFKNRRRCVRHEIAFCKPLQNGYKCNICDSYMHMRSNYEKHLMAHEQNQDLKIVDLFKCNECGMVFKTLELLEKHMQNHGTDKKFWMCDICGRVFFRRDYLTKHKLLHGGKKVHACTQCDFKSIHKTSLTMHIRKHTGERPFACSLCPQRCISTSNLHKHMRLHSGIKKYQCKLCDKKFGQKASLEEHIACIHDSCAELHACEDCGATYTRYRHLQRHLRTKHGKLVSKRENKIDIQNNN